jgi:hypothetical protein
MNAAVTAISRNDPTKRVPYPSLKEATRTWVRVALLSFGGPAGQIAVMAFPWSCGRRTRRGRPEHY